MRFCRWFRIDWKAANYKPAAGATPNRISSRKNNRAAVAWNSCPGQFSDSDKYTDWNKLATFLRGQRLPESTSLNKLIPALWLADINDSSIKPAQKKPSIPREEVLMANLRENVYLLSMLPTKKQHRCGALYRTRLTLSPLIVVIYPNTAIYCDKLALTHNLPTKRVFTLIKITTSI